MRKLAILSLLFCLSIGATKVLAQNYRPNVSLQVGVQGRFFGPASLNYVVDSVYNATFRGVNPDMKNFRQTTGISAGLSYHKGRANLRLQVSTFGARNFGVHTDTLGVKQRTDVAFNGGYADLTLTSELIPITDIFGFYVGGGFSISNLRTLSATVEENRFSSDDALVEANSQWKAGFLVQAPFRLWLGPQVQLSLEPFYQVHFSPMDFSPLGNQVSGISLDRDKLRGEGDHIGANFSVLVYFRKR